MKTTILKFFTLSAAIFAFSTISFGQNDASAAASVGAVIVTPISISKVTDLHFGNLAATDVSYQVELDFAGDRTVTGTDNNVMPTITGSVSVASFTASGLAGAAYAITLPSDDAVTLSGIGAPMTLEAFNHNANLILTSGEETFNVVATLNVNPGQAAGTYNGSFDVKVNYN